MVNYLKVLWGIITVPILVWSLKKRIKVPFVPKEICMNKTIYKYIAVESANEFDKLLATMGSFVRLYAMVCYVKQQMGNTIGDENMRDELLELCDKFKRDIQRASQGDEPDIWWQ